MIMVYTRTIKSYSWENVFVQIDLKEKSYENKKQDYLLLISFFHFLFCLQCISCCSDDVKIPNYFGGQVAVFVTLMVQMMLVFGRKRVSSLFCQESDFAGLLRCMLSFNVFIIHILHNSNPVLIIIEAK